MARRVRRAIRLRLAPGAIALGLLLGAGIATGGQDGGPPAVQVEEPECIVTLKDGGQMSGRLVEETEAEIVIRVGEVRTRFAREDVERLMLVEPVLERYRGMRRAIADDDAEQRLLVSEWLMSERQYALALREVREVLELEPSNPRARELELLLSQQVKLLASARPPGEEGEDPTPHRTPPAEFPLLSAEQINLLRVYEVDLTRPPKMSVSRETVEKILDYYAEHELVPRNPEQRRALFRKGAHEILALLFDLRARELYGQVRVEEDPIAFRRFRVDVHNEWLLRGCATNRCHGGQEAGRLYMANQRWRAEPTVYTNFLILDRFRTSDGRPLIDYEEPEKSLLLEIALPKEISTFPHPVVSELGRERPWRAVISSRDDANFKKTVGWIREMYSPHTDYPIEYTPPVPTGAEEGSAGEPGKPR